MVRDHLCHACGCVLCVHQAPSFSNTSVHANVHCIVNLIQFFNGETVVGGKMRAGQNELTLRVIALVSRHSIEQWDKFPAHIPGPHIEP